MKYEVRDAAAASIISTHRSKAAAIKAAEAEISRDPTRTADRITVVAHEVSGAYESHQQVWPQVSECYSN